MVKADGCVAIHADGGAYKPLNWMNAPNRAGRSTRTTGRHQPQGRDAHHPPGRGGLATRAHELGVDPGLQKDGVEAHLQELLAADPTAIADGLTLVRREFPTDIGPVDLLCRDADGAAVAVEVKRRGEIDGVEQLVRYLERMDRDPSLRPRAWRVRGPGGQAPGQGAGRVPGHRLGRGRLRDAARLREADLTLF